MNVESQIYVNEGTRARVPDNQMPYVERCIGALSLWDEVYRTQLREGFYPSDMTAQELRQAATEQLDLLSPYTLVRRRGRVLVAEKYMDHKNFHELITATADAMSRAIGVAWTTGHPEKEIVEVSLRPQIENLKVGQFDLATLARLNALNTPTIEMFNWMGDRYKDPQGHKFSAQGWLIMRDSRMTEEFSKILQEASRRVQIKGIHRVVAGEVIAFAGLASDRKFSGNTIPSNDLQRREQGSVGFDFLNMLKERLNNGLGEAIKAYTPELLQGKNAEERIARAAGILLMLHESVGHSLAEFDASAAEELTGDYTTMKELEAEVSAHDVALNLPRHILDPEMIKTVLGVSLAWARSDIDEYKKEKDPDKKELMKPYAKSGAMINNFYDREGVIDVNSRGEIRIGDLDRFSRKASQFKEVLRYMVRAEKIRRGQVAGFIRDNAKNPIPYLHQTSFLPGDSSGISSGK